MQRSVIDIESGKIIMCRNRIEEKEQPTNEDGGSLVKSLVFGGLDGIITTFAIVATVAGARAHAGLVLLMGAANLIADALSMGIGDFLSERAEDEFVEAEYHREACDVRESRPVKIAQLEASYVRAGLDPEAARATARALATNDDVLVAHSMFMHQQLLAPGDWRTNGDCSQSRQEAFVTAAKKGATTAGAFVAFGAMPLAAYYAAISIADSPQPELMFTTSCVVTTTTLLLLGAAKAKLTNQPLLESAVAMVVNGGAAALAAFAVGRVLEDFEGWHDLAVGSGEIRPGAGDVKNSVLEEAVLGGAAESKASSHSGASSPVVDVSPAIVFFEVGIASLFSIVGSLPTFCLTSGTTELPNRFVSLANAVAGGAVAAISLALASDAASDERALAGLGFTLGIAAGAARLVLAPSGDDDEDESSKEKSISALAIALASHSAAEGLALGAAYAHSYSRGRTAALSILVHNVPEGLATATVVVGRGKSPFFAAMCAFAAASPQPVAAVLATAFSSIFAGLSSLFVGFAAAMMLWIAFSELIPDALSASQRKDGPGQDVVTLVASAAGLAVTIFLV